MNLKFSSRFGIFLSLFLISPLSQKVKATILEKMDLEKLTNNANLVVIGTVSEIRYDWDEQWKLIFTYVTLEIENCAKGDSQIKRIEIMYPGGILGSKRLYVDGTPEFSVGEKVIVFLEPEIKNKFRVVGWHQGKMKIVNDEVEDSGKSISEFMNEIKVIIDKQQK